LSWDFWFLLSQRKHFLLLLALQHQEMSETLLKLLSAKNLRSVNFK
jgi:hypothetical protein